MNEQIISMQSWLATPPGGYLLAWERAQCDAVVADMFGYHALQLGLPALPALQNNRMPHRWMAVPTWEQIEQVGSIDAVTDQLNPQPSPQPSPDLVTDFAALPFFENTLDLLVLPHSLELSPDPHATLREAQRVLVPEGKLIICCFNPLSLWGLKQWRAHLFRRLGEVLKFEKPNALYLPEAGEFIGYKRVRDWLRLLNFEVEQAHFGCYAPAVRSDKWLQRFAWMDKLGAQYWSIFGSVYFIVAVKRVHGVRLLSPAWKKPAVKAGAPVSVAGKAINSSVIDEIKNKNTEYNKK